MSPTGEAYVQQRKANSVRPTHHADLVQPEIDKGIPIPTQTRGGAHYMSHFYPFEKLEVGDSFWVPVDCKAVIPAMAKFAKKSGWKLISRGQSREGKSNNVAGRTKRGFRIWRVA